MFIYCGDCDNGNLRVLDTTDMITEEVGLLQLKTIQAQGYTIKKDFGCDYAYRYMQRLYKQYEGGYLNSTQCSRELVELNAIASVYNLPLELSAINGESYFSIYYFKDFCLVGFGCDTKEDKIYVVLASYKGVFQSHRSYNNCERLVRAGVKREHDNIVIRFGTFESSLIFLEYDLFGRLVEVQE